MGRTVYECCVFVLALLLIPLEAITVSPALCPTNKIAPHKRHANYNQYGTARTFGAFYDLLVPGGSHGHVPYRPINDDNNLQEEPQEDDPSDCGEIEDYDENDLSSVTPQENRRQGSTNRHFFGPPQNNRPPNYPERPPYRPQRPPNYPERPPNYPERPPNYPERPPNYPERPPNYPERPPNYPERPPNYPQRPPNYPQRPPVRPTRPPYWSGGLFGSNDYRPPLQQYPSDNLKPIHEYSDNSGMPYRPTIVGGSLNQVIGVSPIVPSTEGPTRRPEFTRPELPNRGNSQSNSYPQRRPKSSSSNNRGVLGSFVDLFFK